MKETRFMQRVYSAMQNEEEELTNQVGADIEAAKELGEVDTDELTYTKGENGNVNILDKETGEVTVAETAADEDSTYDLYPADVDTQLEGFLHPEGDGVTPGQQFGEEMEDVSKDHLGGAQISDLDPSMGCEEVREFSISTDNEVVQRIFSDQLYCEKLFSEVIESEQTAIVGDLKIEKDPEDENSVVVTSESTGDQAKVILEDDEMEVIELESKNFSHEEQYLPLHVVGIDTFDNLIVDAPVYTEEDAQDLAQKLAEKGVEAIQIFEDSESAREYAFQLLGSFGIETEEDVEEMVEEPVQAEFSEAEYEIHLTKFYSNTSDYSIRLFSEAINDESYSQDLIEDAIESGEEIENDTEIITPVDATTAVVEDKESGEFTKVELVGEEMEINPITEEEAEELVENLAIDEESERIYSETSEEEVYLERLFSELELEEDERYFSEDEEDERYFSEDEVIYCNEEETRFFSEFEIETINDYMERLYSEEASQELIESAIENGEQIENDTEIITPVDATTAVVEDKESGEFTKAVIVDEESIDVNPITEEEADALTENLALEEKEYCTTSYIERLFSEGGQADIIAAIESGEEVETEKEIIIPISETEAIVEDKENGEFTKVEVDGNDIDVHPLTEEEADELEAEANEEEVEEKEFSTLSKFFSDVVNAEEEEKPSVEVIEDKALAAIQSIQEVAQEAQEAIIEAKEAPVEQQGELKEAQFSQKEINQGEDTLVSWLGNKKN